ncbi:Crp/Fnr family transcriptional regulator [Ideonella sp. 4Y11]|uniref:Crp/Fnr family transcriptional regulator n=1 Tax=Ideonella aquatica TaxID=2824119 RepID=A0A940YFF5_9BURK|nr:Crp/Fnr family transcriptional regulator [Ideonella aquatica]MBQ0959238.1 Crp/Fnr family transcriptional regulator [Ideonella aquatica]
MNHVSHAESVPAPLGLATGETLFEAGHSGPVWQLQSGALRLDQMDREGQRFVQLVLPGDLVGAEQLAASGYAHSARAIVPSVAVQRAVGGDAERRLLLAEALLGQLSRTGDLIALRTGTAQERLRHLLLLLSGAEPGWDEAVASQRALPTIKDVAAIIDTAPETVSRIFANLKRSHLLDGRQRQGARFSAARLREQVWPAGMTRSDGALRPLQLAEA